MWFAGSHSDVGGSYPENEARLSDISLCWMAHAAENFPDGKTPNASTSS
ncbi:phospholipase effector Tle1 domain-containing protein [Bradyrhizobium sp. B120]